MPLLQLPCVVESRELLVAFPDEFGKLSVFPEKAPNVLADSDNSDRHSDKK